MTSSSAAAAPAVIGSAVAGAFACGTGIDTVQLTSTSPSFAATAPGNITSWSTSAGPDTGPTALLVWRPTAAADTFTLVGESSLETLTPNAMNTFPLTSPIAVLTGDRIGLRLEGPVDCAPYGLATDSFGYFVRPADVAISGPELMLPNSGFMLNVSATIGTVTPPPPPPPGPTPTDKEQCKNGGWKLLSDSNGHPFNSQGECVSFVTAGQGDPGASGDHQSGDGSKSGDGSQSAADHQSGGDVQATSGADYGGDRQTRD